MRPTAALVYTRNKSLKSYVWPSALGAASSEASLISSYISDRKLFQGGSTGCILGFILHTALTVCIQKNKPSRVR